MDLYTVDFETYYDKEYSLAKMTMQEYIMDSRFEAIGVSIQKNDEPPVWHTHDWFSNAGLKHYQEVVAPLNGQPVVSHNAMFDMGILAHHFDVRPSVILDTLSMARPIYGLTVGGSLKALATKFRIGAKGTEVLDALGKRRADFDAAELDAYGKYCMNDVALTYQLFKLMKKHTSTTELKVIDQTIRMFTEPRLILDDTLLRSALAEVQSGKSALLEEVGLPRSFVMSNQKLATLLEALGVEVPTKTSPTTGRETLAFAKSDKEFVALKDHEVPLVGRLVEARLANKSTINESRMEKFIAMSDLGPLWVPLSYCGAIGTWRWSGMDGLNMQNLPNRADKTMRRAIMAPKGHSLVVVDSSNIELRTNHTLAGQQDVVQALREGRDLYIEFAAGLYDRSIEDLTEAYKADDPTANRQRFVGKVAHLLLGYQGGWRKFKEMARIMGTDIEDDEAERIVQTWRRTYSRVKKMWYDCDKMIAAIHSKSEYALPSAPFVRTVGGVLLTPPNHYLHYPELRRDDDGFVYTSRRGRGTETVTLYGGKLVEHLCQHISRNILAEQLVTISQRYKVAMMVHDEFVMVVPDDEAEEALDFALKVMSTSPDWWPEIPLSAEGAIAKRYGDAK